MSVVTCVTAQNPRKVLALEPCGTSIVREQLQAVFQELRPEAAKTGMLYSRGLIALIAEWVRKRRLTLVVDPVMVSTSGRRLLGSGAIEMLCQRLLPEATLLTPNLPEAEALTGKPLRSVEDLRGAAKSLQRRFGPAVLVKGGHLKGLRQAVDIYYDGKEELLLSAPFVRGLKTHGTGCTYSAAITAYLARGLALGESVYQAKQFVTQAIAQSQLAGSHNVLNSFWRASRGRRRAARKSIG